MPPARATLIVTAFAALSRILGFGRDILLTGFLGASPAADAFFAAFRLPNAVRRIISEGGFNPAFIPLYLRLKAESPDMAHGFARRACLVWGMMLVLLTVLVELAANPVMHILAGGLKGEAFTLSVLYLRLLFPLVLGSGIAALLGAVLNAERRIVATSLAPLICNLTIVVAIIATQIPHLDAAASGGWIALAAGISGFLHLALTALALHGSGLLPGTLTFRRFSREGANLHRFARSALPVLAATGATQLFPVAAAQVASHIPSAVSWFYYADRLFQLPAGFIAAASGIVLLPQIVRHHARNDLRACVIAQNRALESALLFSLPAAAALAYLSLPITIVLFQRGAFSGTDSIETARLLFLIAFALPLAVMAKILASAVFALGKARSAIVAGMAGLIATLFIAMIAARLFGTPGIAIGVIGGIATHALLLALSLFSAGLWRPDWRLAGRTLRIVAATCVMGLVLAALEHFVSARSFIGLTIHCLAGMAVYALAAWLGGAVSRRDLKRIWRR